MNRINTPLPGACILEPRVFGDPRGFFMEFYNQRTFAELGIDCTFMQDNHSRSRRGVLRGMHYQIGSPQAKLVRVLQGAVYDVVVDLRRGSPTFGQSFGVELSEENQRMFYVPRGFAHGFLTLSTSADLEYKCDEFYTPSAERGITWDDPDLGIVWPLLQDTEVLLSEKDSCLPPLADVPTSELFDFEGENG